MSWDWPNLLLFGCILGGERTEAYPECVMVGTKRGWVASAVLLGPNVALTAGHVVQGDGEGMRVFLGTNIRRRRPEDRIVNVARAVRHPQFKRFMGTGKFERSALKWSSYRNDLALLILAGSTDRVRQYPKIATILHFRKSKEIQVVGFGANDFDGLVPSGSGVKRRATVPTSDKSSPALQKRGLDPKQSFLQKGREFVAADRSNLRKDASIGDGGAPAYVVGRNKEKLLIAICSRADLQNLYAGTRSGHGSVYVFIHPHWNWIQATAERHRGRLGSKLAN